jgi:two-component system sensor histidine kinase PilS (NtrC family)
LLESLIAQERLASLGQLSAAIAHELRNPLAAISGSLELLMGECGPSERRRKLEAIVMREIERLDALVGDFLLYARPSPLEPTPTDLVALIRDLCEVLKSDAAWGDNPVCLEAPDVLEARVDAGQVRQMLWNLLRNALEASERGAVVDVALERMGSCARIVIRDHGAGLDPEIHEHLFEPFRTTKTRGTGLGLAMVERSVRAHGGDVVLRPADGGGTEARVLLPLEAGATFE